MVGDSEKQDFYSSIKSHGFQENDFELTQQRDPTSGTGIYAITGMVTIRCKPNERGKNLQGGARFVLAFPVSRRSYKWCFW
ncbi:MAG: hypothetical protein WDM70_07920 [Nitrosomonadales bacterium]